MPDPTQEMKEISKGLVDAEPASVIVHGVAKVGAAAQRAGAAIRQKLRGGEGRARVPEGATVHRPKRKDIVLPRAGVRRASSRRMSR